MSKELALIGRLELVRLPDLELGVLTAKVDTGAYSSSLHCRNAQVVSNNGKEQLIVQFQAGRKRPKRVFDRFKKTRVKSSNGMVEDRFVIRTRIKIGKRVIKASFTLTDRSEMKYPLLLGRKFLTDRFIVDVSKKHLTR